MGVRGTFTGYVRSMHREGTGCVWGFTDGIRKTKIDKKVCIVQLEMSKTQSVLIGYSKFQNLKFRQDVKHVRTHKLTR